MRAIFQSKFPDSLSICNLAFENSKMIKSGSELYLGFTSLMSRLKTFDDSTYKSIPDIYDELGIEPFTTTSKRMLYSEYNSGIVVGAGSGEECINLIGNNNWHLFDLTDNRMDNRAIGYRECTGYFNMTGILEKFIFQLMMKLVELKAMIALGVVMYHL